MKNILSYKILLISLLLSVYTVSYSQEKTLITPYITIQYFKTTDNQQVLKTTLTYSQNRMELPLSGMEISFFSAVNKKELLGSIVTDKKGVASLTVTPEMKLSADNTGKWLFNTEYKGNDTIEAINAELAISDVTLEAAFTEPDSIKTITVKAYTKTNGKEMPVAGQVVKVYVPRMFSFLPIGEITLDDAGSGFLEFPADLPGDKEGNLTVITKFEENENFGNVEKVENLKWGVPTEYAFPSAHRALWTKTAPKWMIYTLSILLAGVWGHYLFAVISLIRIRINAKRQEELDNYGKQK